jgi:hypothetical protein
VLVGFTVAVDVGVAVMVAVGFTVAVEVGVAVTVVVGVAVTVVVGVAVTVVAGVGIVPPGVGAVDVTVGVAVAVVTTEGEMVEADATEDSNPASSNPDPAMSKRTASARRRIISPLVIQSLSRSLFVPVRILPGVWMRVPQVSRYCDRHWLRRDQRVTGCPIYN